MISEEAFDNIPEDPSEAFVYFERLYREATNKALDNEGPNGSTSVIYIGYINAILAIDAALDLDIFDKWETPDIESVSYSMFQSFVSDVDAYLIETKILKGKKSKKYSVSLNDEQKKQIRKSIENIKSIVEKSDLPVNKKEAINIKINALLQEIEKYRTKFEVFADFATKLGEISGAVESKVAAPWWRWFEKIAEIMGAAKAEEEEGSLKLPAPPEQKRLPPPKKTDDEDDNNGDESLF